MISKPYCLENLLCSCKKRVLSSPGLHPYSAAIFGFKIAILLMLHMRRQVLFLIRHRRMPVVLFLLKRRQMPSPLRRRLMPSPLSRRLTPHASQPGRHLLLFPDADQALPHAEVTAVIAVIWCHCYSRLWVIHLKLFLQPPI